MTTLSTSQRMVKYGFIKAGKKKKYSFDDKKNYWVPASGTYDGGDADQEIWEEATVLPGFMPKSNDYVPSGFPNPFKTYRLTYKSPAASLEETYYWLLDNFRVDWGFPHIEKIVDIFSASEQSAFWGQAQSRLGIQQDRVTQYMATIGKMVKDLFQLVRELRIIEERLDIYKLAPTSKSADVTLKGIYIDLVEGGSKNPGSVYGIAQQVGFTILPDLFFNTKVYDVNKVDSVVKSMNWNDQVKNVLLRKLFSYLNWADKTEKELKDRFKFTLRYLRQHWGVIKMYMSWVKPYLRNIQRMKMHEKHTDSPDLVGAFETSITEIETVAYRPLENGLYPCILLSMKFVTQPELSYHQEGYMHKGPIHTGEINFQLRAYAWTPAELEAYKRMKQEEDFDMIKLIDESVASAMDSLQEDLQHFLELAGENLEKFGIDDSSPDKASKSKAAKQAVGSALDPFISIFAGFWEILNAFGDIGGLFKHEKKSSSPSARDRNAVWGQIKVGMFQIYKNYKKAHGMVAW